MSGGLYVNEDKLIALCQLSDGGHTQLYVLAQAQLSPMRNDPVVAQLTVNDTQARGGVSLEQLFLEAEEKKTPEVSTLYKSVYTCSYVLHPCALIGLTAIPILAIGTHL